VGEGQGFPSVPGWAGKDVEVGKGWASRLWVTSGKTLPLLEPLSCCLCREALGFFNPAFYYLWNFMIWNFQSRNRMVGVGQAVSLEACQESWSFARSWEGVWRCPTMI
jgi:hypothetical protein